MAEPPATESVQAPSLELPSEDAASTSLEEPALEEPSLSETSLQEPSLQEPAPQESSLNEPAAEPQQAAGSQAAEPPASNLNMENLGLQLEGQADPAQAQKPGEPVTRPCPLHPEVQANEKCPQCRRYFCKECAKEMPGYGVMCILCRDQVAKTLIQNDGRKRRRKILILGVSSAAVALILIGLGLWFFLFRSSDSKPSAAAPATSAATSSPSVAATEHTATTTSVIPEEPAPDELPPSIPIVEMDPPPEDLPPQVVIEPPPPSPLTADEKEISRILEAATKVHQEAFSELEEKVQNLKKQFQAKNSSVQTRTRVIQELFRLEHRLCLEPLQEALKDESEEIRTFAATQIGRFGSSRAGQALGETLQHDKSAKVRVAAAAAIARCGDESAIPALIAGLVNPSQAVREACDRALKQFSSQTVAFDPRRPPEEQSEAIGQWRMWYYKSRNKIIQGDWYRMRTVIGQRIATNRFGGGGTLTAVTNAHQWLASIQEPEGYWDQTKHAILDEKTQKPLATPSSSVGLTGLVLLSFLASGHTPEVGEHSQVVTKAVDWLLKIQREDGYFNFKGSVYYGHGICTMALCEVYGMTGSERYKAPAESALRFIIQKQAKEGGYTYSGPGFDTSVSGWQFMAMIAALEAGLEVPETALRRAQYFLRFMYRGDAVTAYNVDTKKNELSGGSPAMTAVGVICRQFFSYPRDDKEIQRSLAHLLKWDPNPKNLYTLYYITLVMFQLGGKEWAEWNIKFKDRLMALQEQDGPAKGSWPPDKVDYASQGGRIYSTVLSTLCLQAYYRYPPIYK